MSIEAITGLVGFTMGFLIAFQTAREIYKPKIDELKIMSEIVRDYIDANKDKELEKLERLL